MKTIDLEAGYCRVFSSNESTKALDDYRYDMDYIASMTDYHNRILQTYGVVFLNEVYESLGLPRTAAGQFVGWVYDPDQPEGDNRIDLRPTLYWCEDEQVIRIDPNVDGDIIDHAIRKGFLER